MVQSTAQTAYFKLLFVYKFTNKMIMTGNIKLQDAFELAARMYKVQQTEWMRPLALLSTCVQCDITSAFLAALAQRIDIALKKGQTFVMTVDEATILKEFFDSNQHSDMVQFLDYSMGDAIEEALAA